MAASRPNAHNVIIQLMKSQGYESNTGGVCRGISFMWHQYFQSGREADFYAQIEHLQSPDFLEKWHQVTDKVKAHLPLTDIEQKIVEVKSLLDGIELYFHILYRGEFSKKLLEESNKELISQFTASKELEKQGGLKKVFTQTRLLNKVGLQKYLKNLRDFHLNLKNSLTDSKKDMPPLSYSFRNEIHEVNFKYDYLQDTWILIDSNQLPPDSKGFSSEEFASQLMKACGDEESSDIVFNVEMLSTKNTHLNFPEIDNSLQQFLALEEITLDEISKLSSRDRTLLCQAILTGDTVSFEKALKDSPSEDLNQSDSLGCSPIHYLMSGSLAALEAFHAAGGNINLGSGAAESPIYRAIRLGNIEVIEYLLDKKVDLKKDLLIEAILNAVTLGHLNVVQYFKKIYPEIDYSILTTKEGHNALQVAAIDGRVDIAKFLIEDCKMDVTVKTHDQQTLYHLAAENNKVDFIRFLKNYPGNDVKAVTATGVTAFNIAIVLGHVEILHELVTDRNILPDVNDPLFVSSMLGAVKRGHFSVLQYFRENFPAIDLSNVQASNGLTLLQQAVQHGQLSIVAFLIEECKADTTHALHDAIHFQQKDVIQFLMTRYPESIVPTSSGRTPAQLAAATNNPEIIQIFSSPGLSSTGGIFKQLPSQPVSNGVSSALGLSKKA